MFRSTLCSWQIYHGSLVRTLGIRALAESDVKLPSIVVHRSTMRVIDGMHRLCAAKLRDKEAIDVQYFHGNDEETFMVTTRKPLCSP